MSEYHVQSLTRAVALLQTFSQNEPSLTIGELARRTCLPRSTVHRLVVNLVQLGLLTRDPVTDRYRPGLMLARLGSIAISQHQIRDVARPIMEALSRASGEGCQLAALDNGIAVYIGRVESDRHKLTLALRIGDEVPLHASGTGKCLLAFTNEDEVQTLLPRGSLPAYTARTITDRAALMQHLREIRERGYSIDSGEGESGLCSIAAPVWDVANHLVAALCLAGPSERLLGERLDALTHLVCQAAADISTALGASLARTGMARSETVLRGSSS